MKKTEQEISQTKLLKSARTIGVKNIPGFKPIDLDKIGNFNQEFDQMKFGSARDPIDQNPIESGDLNSFKLTQVDVDRNYAEYGSQMDQANQNQKFFDSEIQKLNQDSMTNLGNTDEAKETNY